MPQNCWAVKMIPPKLTLSVRNQFANSWVIKRWVMPPLTVCGEGATSNDHSEMIVMPVIANIGSRKDQTIVEACGFGPNFPNWYAQLLKKKNRRFAVLNFWSIPMFSRCQGCVALHLESWPQGLRQPSPQWFRPFSRSMCMVLTVPVRGGWMDA